MQAGAVGEVRLYAASLSFANIEYIERRQASAAQARQFPSRLVQRVEILPVDATTIHRALASDFTDFENSIQHVVACAQPGIHAIITRDPKGFRSSVLPILSVAQALTDLDNPA